MPGRCDSCAFNQNGSGGAADEEANHLKGLICAHGGIPFFCHHTKSGEEYDWSNGVNPLLLPVGERRICGGWRDMVRWLKERGKFFADQKPEDRRLLLRYQRSLATDAIGCLARLIATKDQNEKRTERLDLEDLCRALFDKPL